MLYHTHTYRAQPTVTCTSLFMAEPTLGSKGAEHFGQHTRFVAFRACLPPPLSWVTQGSTQAARAYPSTHLDSIPMADEADDSGPRRSARRPEQRTASQAEAFRATSSRPTALEQAAAERRIEDMRAADLEPPILTNRGRPPATNIVACAMAFQRDEHFESDAEALRQFGVPERYDVRGIWVNGKLARFAAHEEAQWLKKAEFAKGKLQRGQVSSRCTHFAPEAGETEAEREEQMAELQSQIDNTGPSSVSFLKHWSFSVCICQGYITWCNCRKVEHPACMLLDESCGGVGLDNVEDNLRADPSGAWDHTTSEPGVPRGSRPFCAYRAQYFAERGIRLRPLSAEAFLLCYEWHEMLSSDDRAAWAESDVPQDVYKASSLDLIYSMDQLCRVLDKVKEGDFPCKRAGVENPFTTTPGRLYKWFRMSLGYDN